MPCYGSAVLVSVLHSMGPLASEAKMGNEMAKSQLLESWSLRCEVKLEVSVMSQIAGVLNAVGVDVSLPDAKPEALEELLAADVADLADERENKSVVPDDDDMLGDVPTNLVQNNDNCKKCYAAEALGDSRHAAPLFVVAMNENDDRDALDEYEIEYFAGGVFKDGMHCDEDLDKVISPDNLVAMGQMMSAWPEWSDEESIFLEVARATDYEPKNVEFPQARFDSNVFDAVEAVGGDCKSDEVVCKELKAAMRASSFGPQKEEVHDVSNVLSPYVVEKMESTMEAQVVARSLGLSGSGKRRWERRKYDG